MSAVRKQPMRQCVGCGEMKNKRELIRILHTEDGSFCIDVTGRKNGRGAYVCPNSECFEKAVKNHGLDRSFKQPVGKDVYEKLKEEMKAIEDK